MSTNLEALYGPSAPADHSIGESVTFKGFKAGTVLQGKILHVRAPGPTHQGGEDHPLLYIVDTGQGFPVPVAPSQILEGTPKAQPFTAILGTYGFAGSALKSQWEAKMLVTNVEGETIRSLDGQVLKVLSARMDGDEKAGRVLAEVEAVDYSLYCEVCQIMRYEHTCSVCKRKVCLSCCDYNATCDACNTKR